MTRWSQRTVNAPPATVLRRLAAPTADAGPALRVGPAAAGTLVAASHRHPIQRDGVAVAWVELTALSATTTLLEVAAEEPGAAALIECIETAACGPALPERRATPAGGIPRRRQALRAIAAVAVVALVAGSAAAYRLLAPPEPLAVDEAVAQFQQAPAPVAAVATTAARPTRPSQRDDASPRARLDRERRQRASAEADGRDIAEAPQTAVAADASRRGERPAADAQAAHRRERTARPAPPPAEGVYTYTTSGHEEIDQPGGRHDYPRETALTVRHSGCGFTSRWQPLEQRWDEMEVCTGDERTLERMTTQREFFGQRKRSDYRCEPGSRAWHTDAGAAWTTRCADDNTTVTTRFNVVGHEPVDVGGDTVRAVHLRLQATMTGGTRGRWTADRWLHPKTGLVLRLRGSTDATSTTPFGDVRYREQVHLDLQSLEPRR